MPFPALFGISVAFRLAVWGAVVWHYIWPALRERATPENLKPILLLHGFRFLGLAFVRCEDETRNARKIPAELQTVKAQPPAPTAKKAPPSAASTGSASRLCWDRP